MNIETLKQYALEKAVTFPVLDGEIYDLVELAKDEIEQGGSESHECELAAESIAQLINGLKKNTLT